MEKISASIELSPKQILETAEFKQLIPPCTKVYIPDVGTEPIEKMVAAAKKLNDNNYVAVPHFPSRRIVSRAELELRIQKLTQEAGVVEALVIGGGLDVPNGVFTSSLELLEAGSFDKYGIGHIGIAGHPEGSPDFSDSVALDALHLKQNLSDRSDAEFRIVTQFGFDPQKFIHWAIEINNLGINLPVHIGVAGSAKLPTLLKFAALCGVGNSLEFLKKQSTSVLKLAAGFNPERIAQPIEQHWRESDLSEIAQLHVFPFGGLKKSSQWLFERGSWEHENDRTNALEVEGY